MEPAVRTDVSVVISAYRQPKTVALVLEGLRRQTVLPDEVLIADDGSSPPVSDALVASDTAWPFDVHGAWQPDEGFRAARSRNNAIHRARGPRIAFLDQDTVPHAGWLAAHLRHAGPRRVCLARIIPLDPAQSQRLNADTVAAGAFESWYAPCHIRKLRRQQAKYRGYAWMRRLRLPFKLTRPSLSSGNFCAWRDDLVAVNGFDEAYTGWGQEDDDLGRRLWASGVRPVPILTEAMVSHVYHEERHGGWRDGGNLQRYREWGGEVRCARGLADHPHPDVTVRTLHARGSRSVKHGG